MRLNLAISCFLLAAWASAQPAGERPEFEVASIKPADLTPGPGGRVFFRGPRGGPGTDDPGFFTCEACNVYQLILRGFDVQPYQLNGIANAFDSDRFTLKAKIPAGATKDQFLLMLQNLLADRFKLAFHRETKQVTGYELTVAKNGSKMKVSPPDAADGPQAGVADGRAPAPPPPPRIGADGLPVLPKGPGTMIMFGPAMAKMRAAKEPMDKFVQFLSNQMGVPVMDATGLKDNYDFELTWDGAGFGRGGPVLLGPPGGGPPPGAGRGPLDGPETQREPQQTLFSALQSQLGLRLEKKQVSMEMVTIDHYEKKPTEN